MIQLTSLSKPKYKDNLGGLKVKAYFCHYCDVDVIPDRDLEYNNFIGDYAPINEISNDFQFKSGHNWQSIEGVFDKLSMNIEGAGEKESRSHITTVNWQLNGIESQNLGFLEMLKNEWMLWLIPDRNGNYYTLGSDGLPAMTSASGAQTGATAAEERMTTLSIEYSGFIPRIYKGNILETPAP